MKEYNYNGIRYKRNDYGQWQYFSPTYNQWVYASYNMPPIDGKQVYDSDFLEKTFKSKDPYLKETTTKKVEQDASNVKKAQERSNVLNNAIIPTQAKIKYVSSNAPTIENANSLKQLEAQKQKEDEQARKEKELKQQEDARVQHLRNVGSDNTRVNINKDASPKIPTMDENFQQWENITRRQKEEAQRIVHNGDLAKHFPNLRDQYLSEENSHRPGGPLTMEELALEQIRTNPDFFKTLEERKYKDFQKREQESWDEMPWYMKGVNTINALSSDFITTLERGLLEFERPLAFQGLESTDPESFGEDARFYDRALHRDENVLNNALNYINPFRAASSAGQNLQQGDYGDAAIDFASIIPMIKGAKAGWKGMNALMKVNPTKLAGYAGSNLISNASPLVQSISNKATVGNLLTGYGGYEAATNYFPGAYNAYSEGDWKEGNKNLFMGLAMGTPLALEARSSKIIPRTIQGVKGAYNDVATGDSFINNYVNAWKNPAAGLDAEKSTAMFDKIMQSDNFTSAEKAMLKEYQYSSFPFSRPGPQQDAFNNLISKAELAFPQDAVLTRTFSSPSAFEGVTTNEAGQVTGITNQNRPLSFSAGNTGYKDVPTWGKDRIVLSGKNAKKVEGNFIKNRYEPIEEGYYGNIPEEELTVSDFSKQREIDASSRVGDNYYGTQRLSPEEVQAQAEAIYNKKAESYSKPSEWDKDITPEELVGKQRNGPEDLFTLDEAIEFAEGHNARRAEQLRLYADPANKEEAIQKLIGEAEQSFSQGQGPFNELEVMGSGFDMKVVGKFPNERGGLDYVVKPRNIKTQSNNANTAASESSVSATEAGTSSVKIPYNAEKNKATASIIEELRHDRYLKINSPEGQKRIEELIASNPHMKNMTYDDFKNGFANMVNENAMQGSMEEELALINQRIKNLESNPNSNPSQLDRLKKQASKLEGELLFGEEEIEGRTLNAVMKRLRDLSQNTGSDTDAINLTRQNSQKYSDALPSDIYSILASPELTADDLARIVEHEFGHYFQQGAKTNLDKMLSKISLKPNSPSLNSNLFSDEKGISNFYNKLMGDSDPFKRMSKYWRTGSKGQEKTAFMEEVRADMLQRGIIDDLYQTITPEMLTNHYTKYMGEIGNKYPLRIYEIMQNKLGNFKIMSDVLNKMPGVVPIGIGGAGMMMMQNSEQEQMPENKYGGNIKTLSKFIRK